MNPRIVELAQCDSAIQAIRQGLIHCGFELEFHKVNGYSREDAESEIDFDADPDYDLLNERAKMAWDAVHMIDLSDYFEKDVQDLVKSIASIMNIEPRHAWSEIFSYIDGDLYRQITALYSDIKDRWIDDWCDQELHDNPEQYYPEKEAYISDHFKAVGGSDYEFGDDSSVRGGEIRTLGPIEPLRFIDLAADLFAENKFEIDEGCSFHIHLSVPNVRHYYGEQMQSELTSYLLNNINRFPESVKERLMSDKRKEYARLRVSTDKYTAVHFHPQGTWEFRIFGNVKDEQSARRCLILAIEAFIHAYKVKLGKSKPLFKGDIPVFNELAEKAVFKPITKLHREHRIHQAG